MLVGAAVAVWLAHYADVRPPEEAQSASRRGGDALEAGDAAALHEHGVAVADSTPRAASAPSTPATGGAP